MGLFDELKAKADMNNDGKIDKADLDHLNNGENSSMIDNLKAKADTNNDGKLSFDDIKGIFGQ